MKTLLNNPQILIIGKTNVGKSTLFNRFAKMKLSIAHDTPGATRDFISREVKILKKSYDLVDSGGIDHLNKGEIWQDVIKRTSRFIDEKADLVIFMLSAKEGVTPDDYEVAQMLRKCNKPVITVINKVDDDCHALDAYDTYRLGIEDPILISALHNKGIKELSERIQDSTSNKSGLSLGNLSIIQNEDNNAGTSIAIVGRPNSGKSTFINSILNEDRVLVSSESGTTLDAVDTNLIYSGHNICLVDTAGIRRQRSIDNVLEKMAVARTLCAIDRADVSLMLIDANEGITEQDKKIAGLIFEKKKALVFAVNKWDESVRKTSSKEKFIEQIRYEIPFVSYAPFVFMSAKYGQKVFNAIDKALELSKRIKTNINTSKLNRSLEKAQVKHPPPVVMGRRLRMYFATQVHSSPPTFSIICSKPKAVHFSYQRYLTNFLRNDLSLQGIPLRLLFKSKDQGIRNEKNIKS